MRSFSLVLREKGTDLPPAVFEFSVPRTKNRFRDQKAVLEKVLYQCFREEALNLVGGKLKKPGAKPDDSPE